MSAAGILLATAILVGAVTGIFLGEPSVGLIAGLAAGIILAIISGVRARK
ncbi:MAG: hypothetical protein AAF205_13555 [Pseudomonadota bacterium]